MNMKTIGFGVLHSILCGTNYLFTLRMKLQAMSPSQIIIRILGEESGFVKTFQTRGGGYLGKFLLGMCRWPLRAPTPL